jgi:membrane-bound ClpP family serine protease
LPPSLRVSTDLTSSNRPTDPISKRAAGARSERLIMIVLGIILLIAGFLLKISILWTIGIILLVIGVILAILGSAGRAVGPRRHYF